MMKDARGVEVGDIGDRNRYGDLLGLDPFAREQWSVKYTFVSFPDKSIVIGKLEKQQGTLA